MIEIGRESRMSLATRRTAATLTGMSTLLGIVWLIRGPLGIQQYSVTVLLAGFGLFFLGRVLRTETNSGAGRALVSFLWNLVAAFVTIILSIWILGWVSSLQSDAFPTVISGWVPELVDSMPETTAADLLKSLANTDRLKMVKMLYSSRKTFSDFKTVTGLEAASVNNHLKSLLNMGLVSHSDEGGYELTKRGRMLVRTLALMSEALGGVQID